MLRRERREFDSRHLHLNMADEFYVWDEDFSISEALDALARFADTQEDGSYAFWIKEFLPEHPEYQVLLVTKKNSERLTQLRQIHDDWYDLPPVEEE